MPKKKSKAKVVRALPSGPSPPSSVMKHQPIKETVVIHTTREKKRNAGLGGVLADPKTNKLILAGGALAGGAASFLLADKMKLSPVMAGAAAGGVALAASSMVKSPDAKDALAAAGLGAAGVAGVQLFAQWWNKRAEAAKPDAPQQKGKRQADGYVTRDELNDALGRLAESSKEQQKQQTCDLMTALRDEIKKVVVETQKPKPTAAQAFAMPLASSRYRAADGVDEYARNAYGDLDERNADFDEYARNAYGDLDERNADVDEYARNAYGDLDERNADFDEYARNAYGDEERNAFADEERNAFGDFDERNAVVLDDDYARNAYGDEERNAYGEDERNALVEEMQAAA